MSAIEAVLAAVAVEEATKRIPPGATHTFFSKYDLWMYNAVLDDKLCDICLKYEENPRFFGDQIRTEFPYLEIINENTIKTHTHMPRDDNCRCTLTRVTDWSLDDIKWFIAYAGELT